MSNITDINLVIYSLVPEEMLFIEVPASWITEEELRKIHNTYGGSDDLTEEQSSIHALLQGEAAKLKTLDAKQPIVASRYANIFHAGFIL